MRQQKIDTVNSVVKLTVMLLLIFFSFPILGYSQKKGLIEDLKSAEWKVRESAARALGFMKDPRAVEPLIAALKDEKWQVQRAAARALGELKDPRAVEPLIITFKQRGIVYPGEAAAISLGKIKDPRAFEPLLAALKNKKSGVQEKAAIALGMLEDPRAVEPLIALLDDPSLRPHEQERVISVLGELKDPRAVEPLIAHLKDKRKSTRIATAHAFKEMAPVGFDSIVAVLQDKSLFGRTGAAYALGFIKDPRAVEPLIIALKDHNSDVQKEAARALDEINDPRSIEPLIAALAKKNLPVVAGACSFYIRRGESSAEAVLIEALNTYGDARIAVIFLNCGNPRLVEAGRQWATTHGYSISPGLPGGNKPKWGK